MSDTRAHPSRRTLMQMGAALGAASLVQGTARAGEAAPAAGADEKLSLKGKTIAISVAGTDHFFDLKAYQAQVETVKELGGTPIGLDAGRSDKALVSQLQTLVTQKPDAVIQTLGTLTVVDPWLKKLRQAGIPVFSVDLPSTNVINTATSDNFSLGAQLALQLVSDINGRGKIVVFNGFAGVPVCEIRYTELKTVLKYYPEASIVQPELRDVIPNTVQDAYGQITALLSKYPEKGSIAAIWSAWDIPQLGATQALIAAGRTEIRTYGVDGTPEVLALVKDPNAPAGAVAAQQPAAIGRTAVLNVARYLNGDRSLPSQTFLPAIIANKANAAEVQRQLGQA
ncbi:sugar ABC transporter substrate-binding protein [Methylobacterium pseudosasicola]|uniref:Monosaccharide ABC transporter substrate-binding protein, CUT2 family n=1 Tax=Methylobacterium pseudosasicola TaxID=582667 RepID=A0A1I4HBA6_9HYPH|nr:sugar ABC transporter substrate-binding protein [Methylobacterium pseudosasicola]SFL39494.1 monosaccharide ABC transporter substrate-binding protein, CUT2 family [Methylobacterium pseudosasicola]